jgi:hypothetical protein
MDYYLTSDMEMGAKMSPEILSVFLNLTSSSRAKLCFLKDSLSNLFHVSKKKWSQKGPKVSELSAWPIGTCNFCY